MNLNVLNNFPFSKRYYLTHPWRWFKELYYNARAGYERATKGFAARDVWDMYNWFLTIMPEMLRFLAEHHKAYPGPYTKFDTPEKWKTWLLSMADAFDGCTEDYVESHNEYAKDYYKALANARLVKHDGHTTITYDVTQHLNDVAELYRLREEELFNEQKKLLEDTLQQLGENLSYLWD